MGCDRKRGTKEDSKVFNLSDMLNGGSYLVGVSFTVGQG